MFAFKRKESQPAAQTPRRSVARCAAVAGAETPAPGLSVDFARIAVTAARNGVLGSGAPLPHLGRIQMSFGSRHSLSTVRAHVGGAAGDAARSIGARAYTIGQSVAFDAAPDVRLAAHEAAHVVQQRAGVPAARAGDSFELAADAVAERVAGGQSAADLLSPPQQIRRASSAVVQLQPLWSKDEISAIQSELVRLGLYSLKVDGDLGQGTKSGLVEAFGDDSWQGLAAAAVISRLKAAKAPGGGKKGEHTFRWGEMFKDGLLDMVIGVGFDEGGANKRAYESFGKALVDAKFVKTDAVAAGKLYTKAGRALGPSAFGDFFVRENAISYTPPAGATRQIDAVVRLVGSVDGKKGGEAAAAFKEGMVQSDIAYYSGHGRYGSGPDFDRNFTFDLLGPDGLIQQTIADYNVLAESMTKEGKPSGRDSWSQFLWRVSNKTIDVHATNVGNVVLNVKNPLPGSFGAKLMYWNLNRSAGGSPAVTGASGQLATGAAAASGHQYRIMVFDGCNSRHYVTPLHATPGFDPTRADVLGSSRELLWGDEGATLVQFLDGILKMQSAEEIITNMDKQQSGGTGAYHGYGIGDNPVIK